MNDKAKIDALRAALYQATMDALSDDMDEWYANARKVLALTADASEQAPECCDTPNYCSSVRRCTAKDAAPSAPVATMKPAQEVALQALADQAQELNLGYGAAPVADTGAVERDPVVEKVREALLARSQLGIKKYGDTLYNMNYSEREILQHAIEESMDLSNYLMARIMKIDEECTCPSGDGSLRWPCPSHPPTPASPPTADSAESDIVMTISERNQGVTSTDSTVPAIPRTTADSAPRFDEAEFYEMVKRGTATWKDVPDDWLEKFRGGADSAADARDAARGRFITEHGAWHRSAGKTYLAVEVAAKSNLSCLALRRDAIDAAIASMHPTTGKVVS